MSAAVAWILIIAYLPVNHIIGGPELSALEDRVRLSAELIDQFEANGWDNSIHIPLIIPVDESETSDNGPEGNADPLPEAHAEPELPKEEAESSQAARQSSIFKLLSPALPSAGTTAPPSLSDRDMLAMASQNTHDEVEAML